MTSVPALPRRERQVMDGLYQFGPSTVAEVLTFLADPPSYSAVRALLGTMEAKGLLLHSQEGARYVYAPVSERQSASRSALRHVVRTYFDGSTEATVAALISDAGAQPEELERLARLIDTVRRTNRITE